MEYLPDEPRQPADKIVEGEVIDDGTGGAPADELDPFGRFEAEPESFLRRTLARLALALLIGLLGVGLIVFGVVLTVSVIGAFIGIPLLIFGCAMILAGLWILLGGGSVRVATMRRRGGL